MPAAVVVAVTFAVTVTVTVTISKSTRRRRVQRWMGQHRDGQRSMFVARRREMLEIL